MGAELQSCNTSALLQLQRKYDKKINILGCGKLHIKFEYSQTLFVTTSEIYDALS